MPITYVANDPAAGAPPARSQAPRPDRPAGRSGYTLNNASPEGLAQPGTPQFLFWQCREAALATLEAWEASAGTHRRWQGNRANLPLDQNAGSAFNASYNRNSFSFFEGTTHGRAYFSGESADVVAHEVGHGLLDSIRPGLFDGGLLFEAGAFHEAFGDIMAILTSLRDRATRDSLLAAGGNLRRSNFVETTAEELSGAIGLAFPGRNAGAPRKAFNSFRYQLPTSLPSNGGPGVLINEEHSFAQIFTGCFWELIANLFDAGPQTQADLAVAATLAGKILVAGTKNAAIVPRFFQSVGRAMVLADQNANGGANRVHIGNAFQAHGIQLGSNALLAPTMALAGPPPKGKRLSQATRNDLRERLGAGPDTRFSLKAVVTEGAQVVEVAHTREVPLRSVDPRLKGVVGLTHDTVRVGDSGNRAAVFGLMPIPSDTDNEVLDYVKTLVDNGRIDYGRPTYALVAPTASTDITHEVQDIDGQKTLVRVRFQCSCCGHRHRTDLHS